MLHKIKINLLKINLRRGVLPIGALFAGTLWLGNSAYLYLSVSFIQMLKASMPVVVFLVGVCMELESPTLATGVNMVVVPCTY